MKDEALAKAMGETLLALRKRRAMTQVGLAGRAGCNPSQVSHLEAGMGLPSLPLLMRIAAALGTDAWNILRNAEVRLKGSGVTR